MKTFKEWHSKIHGDKEFRMSETSYIAAVEQMLNDHAKEIEELKKESLMYEGMISQLEERVSELEGNVF